MGRNTVALTEKQAAVLEWVKDGCRGAGEDYGRRITARALHRRGLISVKGRGNSWSATITGTGRAWFEERSKGAAGDGRDRAEDLVRGVVAAGGTLVIGGYGAELAHDDLVRASLYSPSRPKGWRLEIGSPCGASHYEVVLVRHFDDLVDPVSPIFETPQTRSAKLPRLTSPGRAAQA
jgi:hypothetical protein